MHDFHSINQRRRGLYASAIKPGLPSNNSKHSKKQNTTGHVLRKAFYVALGLFLCLLLV